MGQGLREIVGTRARFGLYLVRGPGDHGFDQLSPSRIGLHELMPYGLRCIHE